MTIHTFKGYVQGSKWSGIKEFLFELASAAKLPIKFLEEDKGWFRTTIWYEVEGDEENINWFGNKITTTIEAHNDKTHT